MDDRSLWELILHYGLFLGGIFQLICILAIVIVPSDNSLDDEGILLNKEDKLRKSQGQQTVQSQIRLRERRKKKWYCCYYVWIPLKFFESSPGLKKRNQAFILNLLMFSSGGTSDAEIWTWLYIKAKTIVHQCTVVYIVCTVDGARYMR